MPNENWSMSIARICACLVTMLATSLARADFATFVIDELYSNADGSVQYVVLREAQGTNGANVRGAGEPNHRRRVLQRRARPLLHESACSRYRCGRLRTVFRMVAHRLFARSVSDDGCWGCHDESGLPVLHSTAARRFALFLGIGRRMRGSAGE